MDHAPRPEAQRLSKRLASQLPCSRSDAENYIAGGWVSVDGVVVEEPMERVRDDQTVALDPKARLEPLESVTLIWHKPPNRVLPDEPFLPDALAAKWLASAKRFKGDRSGVRPLKAHHHRLLPVAAGYVSSVTPHILPGVVSGVNKIQRLRKTLPGQVAQLVEHRTENPGVVGSTPTLSTSPKTKPRSSLRGLFA